MRRTRVSAALVVALVVVLTAACTQDPGTSGEGSPSSSRAASTGRPFPTLPARSLPPPKTDALRRELERWVSTGLIPGVTAAVATPQGVWSGAAGVDGAGAPLSPDSGMALASITKTFTAAEVMLLAEQGKVDLDAPASTYVPRPQVANGVTVRQLLAQRASVPDPGEKPYASVLTDLDRHWSIQQILAPVSKATEPPGTRFYYDNVNYVLLGLVVEQASGTDVATAVMTDLWRPLGLDRLAWQDEQRLAPPLAQPGEDALVPNGIPPSPYLPYRAIASAVGAAGGVVGDAEAVARWGYELYGGRVLHAASVAQMTDFTDGDGYGLGTRDYTARGYVRWNIDAVGHDGSTIGYRTVMAVFEAEQVSVAILTPSTTEVVPYVQYLVKAGALLR